MHKMCSRSRLGELHQAIAGLGEENGRGEETGGEKRKGIKVRGSRELKGREREGMTKQREEEGKNPINYCWKQIDAITCEYHGNLRTRAGKIEHFTQ